MTLDERFEIAGRIAALFTSFVGCVIASNIATSAFGLIPVGFGATATAGTLFAGLSFSVRDALHEAAGGRRLVVSAIVVGAVASAVAAGGRLAVASGVAFLVSELTDAAVYEPLRHRNRVAAIVASNTVGAAVDSVLFLAMAGFPLSATPGQMIGKTWATVAAVAAVAAARRWR